MVDVVVYLNLEEDGKRSIVAQKNRFGHAGEKYELEMKESGMTDLPPADKANLHVVLDDKQLQVILKDHPIWSLLVKASLYWLQKQAKEKYGE
jgi:hypothetical protein